MAEAIKSYRELRVYQSALNTAMEIYLLAKKLPPEEKYSLTDQMIRAARSVCANMGEAWRKRRYEAAFIAKLSDSETEAGEMQVHLEIAMRCSYISEKTFIEFFDKYEIIISQIVKMIDGSAKWVINASFG